MTDRPIIFSAGMVRGLIDGRKTQTRRVLKPQPEHLQVYDWRGKRLHDSEYRHWCWNGHVGADNWDDISTQLRPFLPFAPGDRLWVREGFGWLSGCGWRYRADGRDVEEFIEDGELRWKSPIHMPRRASRLTLIVTDVRVQRLQEISAEDAAAEGIPFEADALAPYEWSVTRFADLWESIHGTNAWDANPLVCAITFDVKRGNIDRIGGTE